MEKDFLDVPSPEEAKDAHAKVEELVDLEKFSDHEIGALALDCMHELSRRTGGPPEMIAYAMTQAIAIKRSQ